jgi:hypothetical protein
VRVIAYQGVLHYYLVDDVDKAVCG